MNRFAYLTTGYGVKVLSDLLKARFILNDKKNIPDQGSLIFVINHFTRIETIFLPYFFHHLTNGTPIWSLADYKLFEGTIGKFLNNVGAVSTRNPNRDTLIVKTLLTGEASWIIFPEGFMVKNKKMLEKGKFMLANAEGKRPPHTGASTLALRTEFYRERLKYMIEKQPDEAKRLADLFGIEDINSVLDKKSYIVPVNITYFPIRAKENFLSKMAVHLKEDISERLVEELMTEGNMLLSGVDIDIRFGKPISMSEYLNHPLILNDIRSEVQINFDDKISSKSFMQKAVFNLMYRYMSAIYSMTTVNHDHLFASILRMMPFHKFEEMDLRRRVFLATTYQLNEKGVYLHKELGLDQVHLLTDDRYHKYSDFMSVATEKGIVAIKGTTIEKSPNVLSSAFGFHRIRIMNPIEVIANEVEPLKPLQWLARQISWMPPYWVKRKVVKYLIEKSLDDYERDYKKYYKEGESKPKSVGMPILLKGDYNKTGVLLIHGYMAAPPEVKELAEYLNQKGLWVYAPRLKGHGTSPDDLAGCTYSDWVESVDYGYAIIRNMCDRVIVGGFSFGGGLALDLCARVNDIAAIFAVCPPMRLQDLSAKFVPAVNIWNKLMKKVHLESAAKDFIDNEPEHPHINYFRNPISGITQLEKLMNTLHDKLPDIKQSALIVQSIDDPVVNHKGSRKLYERIGSKNKQYVLFNFKKHGILLGKESYRVHRVIWDFIRNLTSE